jgi:hypothetical protein
MSTGCDTRIQINTGNRLNNLINNGHFTPTFVCRYLKNATSSSPKELTPEEVTLLSSASLKIVSLFELYGESVSGFVSPKGTNHAKAAISRAATLGQPGGTPIYFCVDFEPTTSEQNTIKNYFDEIYAVFTNNTENPNGYKFGVYGCGSVCSMIKSRYESSAFNNYYIHTFLCLPYESFTNYNLKQHLPQYSIGSGSNLVVLLKDTSNSNGNPIGSWHQHSYPVVGENYGNNKKHRFSCIICGHTIYKPHVPNSTYTQCTVCGYTGNLPAPDNIGGEEVE